MSDSQRLEQQAREMDARRAAALAARVERERVLRGEALRRALAVDRMIDAANERARLLRASLDGAAREGATDAEAGELAGDNVAGPLGVDRPVTGLARAFSR